MEGHWNLTQRGPLAPKGGIGLSGFIVGFGFLRREAYYSLQLCPSEVRGISALGSDFDEKYFVFWVVALECGIGFLRRGPSFVGMTILGVIALD